MSSRFLAILLAFVYVSVGIVIGASLFKLGENRGEAAPTYVFSNFDIAKVAKSAGFKYTPHRAADKIIDRRRHAYILMQSGTVTAPKGSFVAYRLHRKVREETNIYNYSERLPVVGNALGNVKAARTTPSFAIFPYSNTNERPARMGRLMLWLFPNEDETKVDVAVTLREDESVPPQVK